MSLLLICGNAIEKGFDVNFIARWIATAIAAAVAVFLVPGITVAGGSSAFIPVVAFALILALIDCTIKPILQLIGAPISIITLGIFYIMINAFLLYLASWTSIALFGTGIVIASWFSALFAAIIISIVTTIMEGILGVENDGLR